MGILYGLTQKIKALELLAAPGDCVELADRITKFAQRGICLEKLLIKPMEGNGCLIWESKLGSSDPPAYFKLFYEAHFSNGKAYTIVDDFATLSEGRLMRGCCTMSLYPEQNPVHIGRRKLVQYAVEMKSWFDLKGIDAEIYGTQ
ncbi:MAG: hypothetical protein V1743_04600 [Nanoarchaeota archaeon]